MSTETQARDAVKGSLASRVPRELFRRDLKRCLLAISSVWAGIVLAWWVAASSGGWLLAPAVLLIGTLQYHLNVMGHDGLHFLICDRRRINDAICRWLLHGPHCAPLSAMRRNHLNHHTGFGSDADLDRQYYDMRRFNSGITFRRWLATALIGGMTVPIVLKLLGGKRGASRAITTPTAGPTTPERWLDTLSVAGSQIWIAGACWFATGWWYAYFLLWLLPLLTVMVGLNSIRSCLEHAQVRSGQPGLHSFSSHLLERFFLSPFNMNVHAEHHLVPAVPWHQLPALRRHLQSEGDYERVTLYRSYLQRARLMAEGCAAPDSR